MLHHLRAPRSALLVLLLVALTATLSACGSIPPADSAERAPSTSAASDAVPGFEEAPVNQPATAIDLTQLDVCAMFPASAVEPITGKIVAPLTSTISVGNEVGCEYTVENGFAYTITAYDLDRWELLPQFLDVEPLPGIGDGAYTQKPVGGGTSLYVLLKDRVIVNVTYSGADLTQLRKLLDVAMAGLR